MPIPRVLHQIWLGPSPLPEQDAAYVETWKRLHPTWEHRLWTENDLPDDVRPEVRERLRVPAERSDLLRLELVARYGGVYVDTDFEALRPLDPLLEGVELFAAYLRDDFEDGSDVPARINNAIFGATPRHPVVVRALAEARPSETYGLDKHGVGPLFLDRMFQGSGATFFDRRLFYPWPIERDGAVAYHHQARTWKDADGMRHSLRIAERRRRAALHELRELELRGTLRAHPRSAAARARWELFRADTLATRAGGRLRREARRVHAAAGAALGPPAELARARVAGALAHGGAAVVPRSIHLIWLHGPPPVHVARRAAAWRLANPGWRVEVWTEANLPAAARPEVTERLRAPAERADVLRLDILRNEGGVVVAPELAVRSLARLAAGATCFAAADGGRPTTALVGATPGHPAIEAAIDEQRPREWSGYDADATGAGALARARAGGAEIVLLRRPETSGSDDQTATRGALLDAVLALETEVAELEERIAEVRTALHLGRDER